jgi:hypothetical protein
MESRFVMRTFAVLWTLALVGVLAFRAWGADLPDQKTVADYLVARVAHECPSKPMPSPAGYATYLRTVCIRQGHRSLPLHDWQAEANALVMSWCAVGVTP